MNFKTVLSAWFDNLAENFAYKEVQSKSFASI